MCLYCRRLRLTAANRREWTLCHLHLDHRCDACNGQWHTGITARQPGYVCATRDWIKYRCDASAREGDIMQIDYPYHFDNRGHTADTSAQDHIRDMIEQILFTSPGERVNRPDFGCGIQRLVFAHNSDALAAATQVIVQGSLQQWMADL